jgi:nonsense-mediated mRNA decay protein 3
MLRRIIKNNFKISKELHKVDINIEFNETSNGLKCKVYVLGLIKEKEINEEHDLLVRLRKTVCEICSRKFGGYHEAIIQIRTERRAFSNEELIDIKTTVEGIIENMQDKGNRTLYIADIAEKHGWLDFFISDKNAAFTISKIILDKYGGFIKKSSKNTGMKDSKQIHRITYLIRIPPYKKGDLIRIYNNYYKIKNLHSNKIKLINLSNWEEKSIDIKNLEKAKILDKQDLLRQMIVVSQNKSELQLMDEKTYELHNVKKPEKIEYLTKKIEVIKIDDLIFIYPKKLN